MNSKRFQFLLLSLILAAAGLALIIHYRSVSKGERRLEQTIALLDLSRLPNTFTSKLISAERAVQRPVPSPNSILELARLYHANGFYDEAMARYQELLRNDDITLRAKAHYYIANVMAAEGDFEGAAKHLIETISLAPSYLPAHLNLAEIRFKSGRSIEAIALFNSVLNLDPENPYALLGLARERAQNHDEEQALDYLKSLASAHPNFTNGSSLLAQILQRRGQEEKAAIARSRSQTSWDLPPEDPWMDETMQFCYDTQRLGIYFEDYKRVGQISRAMAYLDRIETVDPGNWNSRLMRAYTYVEMEDYAKSLPYYERALELGGNPAIIYPQLAKTYFELKLYPEAESAARKGIEISPNDAEILVTMAGIYLQKNEPKEAISLFQQALSIDPYHLLANTVLAKYHWQSGNWSIALKYLEVIQQVDPSDLFSRVFMGQYYLENDLPYKAIQPLEQAIAIDPNDEYVLIMLPDAYAMIGDLQRDQGQFEQALESYEKALAVDPRHTAAAEGKATLLKTSTLAN